MAQFLPPQPLTKKQNDDSLRLIEQLVRRSRRLNGGVETKRRSARAVYRKRVYVFVPDGYKRFGDRDVEYSFEGWAVNLATGGISIISAIQIEVDQVIVCLNPEKPDKNLLHARLANRRRVSEEFWQYGFELNRVSNRSQKLRILHLQAEMPRHPAAAPERDNRGERRWRIGAGALNHLLLG